MPDEMTREQLEQYVMIEEELERRRKDDPIFSFDLTPAQRPFVESVFKGQKRENWFIAANRSGKSDAGAYIGSCLARFGEDPKRPSIGPSGIEVYDRATSGWVSSVDFPTARDVIQPKYFDNGFVPPGVTHPPFIPPREIARNGWRVSDQVLKLKNGSIIGFKSADSGRTKYQGTEKEWVHLDEEHPEDIYQEISIRIGAKPLRIFGTATLLPPEGTVGGVTWMFPKIIQPWQSGNLQNVGLFSASIYENPHISREEIAILEAKFPPHTTEGRIRLGGEWLPGLAGARAYPSFNRQLHVRDQIWPPMPRRPVSWCWDFNVEPLVTHIGQRLGRVFHVMRQLVMEEGSIPEMCQLFYEELPRHSGEIWIYGDATEGRTAQTGKAEYQIILNEMRRYGVPIRKKVQRSNPPVPDRIAATNTALRNEAGEVLVQIDPSCEELIADYEQVLRDGRGGIKKTYDPRNPYYRRTHSSDGVGYWISYEEPVRSLIRRTRRMRPPPTPRYGGGVLARNR